MLKKTLSVLSIIFFVINLVVAGLLLASGYAGYVNPDKWDWLVSLPLFFPFFLCANVAFVLFWLICRSYKSLLSVIVLLVCVVPIRTYFPVNIPQPVPKGSIKIVSYNTFGYGYGSKDTTHYNQMLNYLRESNADILCAQESNYNLGHKKSIEEATKHWRYKDSVLVTETHNALTLYSNFPILDRHIIRSSSKSHICVVYKVKLKHESILVVNSHFVSNSISSDDKDTYSQLVTMNDKEGAKDDLIRLCHKVNKAGLKRAEQADMLADYLSKQGDIPIILCGDFNDSPLSYTHNKLVGILNDTYTRSGNGPGITYHMSKMFFRLDNILCSHHWRAFGAKVDSEQKMSDHYPIQAWLKRVR